MKIVLLGYMASGKSSIGKKLAKMLNVPFVDLDDLISEKEELINFAIWQIVDTNEFKEYIFFENEYDKSEWRRKFWKRKDPPVSVNSNERLLSA